MQNKIFIVLFIVIIFSSILLHSNDKPEIYAQLGHSHQINSIVYSPDGKIIVSVSDDKTIKLWNVKSGRLIKTLTGHAHQINTVDISPDSKFMVTGSADKNIILWDLKTMSIVWKNKKHLDQIRQTVFSPDSKFILSCASNDTKTYLWDVKNGKLIKYFNNSYSFSTASFSPNGKLIALGGGQLKVISLKDNKELFTIKHSSKKIIFTKDGKSIIALGYKLSKIDIKTAKVVKEYTSKTGKNISLSPDNKIIAHDRYKEIQIYDQFSGKLISNDIKDTSIINSITFSPNGKQLAYATDDAKIKILDLKNIKETRIIQGFSFAVNKVVYSSDKKTIAFACNDKTIKIWDSVNGKQISVLKGHIDEVSSVSFSPDNKYLISSGKDLKLWDLEKKEEIHTFSDRYYSGRAIQFSPDGRTILSVYRDHSIRLFDTLSKKLIRIYKGHQSSIQSIDFSPDSKYFVSSDYDRTIKFWELKNSLELISITEHSDVVNAVKFSSDGKYIVSGSYDGEIKIWEVQYDLGFLKEINSFKTINIKDCCFSADGKKIIVSGYNGQIKIFNAENKKEIFTLNGHKSTVTSVTTSLDERFILSSSLDGTVKIWNAVTGNELASFISFSDIEWVSVTPDGYFNSSKDGAKQLNVQLGGHIYSIDNFTETFYRPDIIQQVLSGRSLTKKISIQNIKNPPTIIIDDIQKSGDKALIKLNIIDNGGGIGDVRIFNNKSAVILDNTRELKTNKSKKTHLEYSIQLIDGENEIKIIAFNNDNTMQSNEEIKKIIVNIKNDYQSSLYGLIIGIDEYNNPNFKLNYAVADAKMFNQTINKISSSIFKDINIKLLLNKEETTKENILKELKSFNNIQAQDLFIFYVASHGTVDEGEYFLMSSNVGSVSNQKLKEQAISQNTLKEIIANISCSKKLIILDTCNSQALGESIQAAMLTRGITFARAVKILSRAVGVTILCAASSSQEALEGYQGHGLFTYVLVEGLLGKADYDKDKFIKTLEIANYIDNEVPILADKIFKHLQYPFVSPVGQTYPIGFIK